MKKEKQKKIRIKREKPVREKKVKKERLSLASRFRRKGEGADKAAEHISFEAKTLSSEPILRLGDEKKQAVWQNGLVINCACAALLTAALAVFCMLIYSPGLIPFTLTCAVVFMGVVTAAELKPGIAKWITAAVILLILLVTAIIWRNALFGSIASMINSFYDTAEEAQAYIYNRPEAGDVPSDAALRASVAWVSALLGLIAALPPARMRRGLSVLIAVAVMLSLAYYGLIPSAVCIAVFIAALIAAVACGNMLSFVPVMLAALLIFGAVMLINPGENYGISRVDENLRDRFALNSALLEGTDAFSEEEDYEDYEEDYEDTEDEDFTEEESGIGSYAVYGSIALAVLLAGGIFFLLYRRFSRKRAQNRKGINSKDPREAVAAMFPYTVRWLRGYGVEQPDVSFTSMAPALSDEFSENYSDRFCSMYNVWSEAAYSDHSVSEETRFLMESFMKDTIDQINSKCRFRDKLRLKLRYAL